MAILFCFLLPIAHIPLYLKMRTNLPTCETAKSWDSLREVPGVPGILSEVLKVPGVPGVPGLLSEVLGMPGVLLWVPLGKLDRCSVEAGTFVIHVEGQRILQSCIVSDQDQISISGYL